MNKRGEGYERYVVQQGVVKNQGEKRIQQVANR
jgi:hypothetical protein